MVRPFTDDHRSPRRCHLDDPPPTLRRTGAGTPAPRLRARHPRSIDDAERGDDRRILLIATNDMFCHVYQDLTDLLATATTARSSPGPSSSSTSPAAGCTRSSPPTGGWRRWNRHRPGATRGRPAALVHGGRARDAVRHARHPDVLTRSRIRWSGRCPCPASTTRTCREVIVPCRNTSNTTPATGCTTPCTPPAGRTDPPDPYRPTTTREGLLPSTIRSAARPPPGPGRGGPGRRRCSSWSGSGGTRTRRRSGGRVDRYVAVAFTALGAWCWPGCPVSRSVG